MNGLHLITETTLDSLVLQYQSKAAKYNELGIAAAYLIAQLTWQLAIAQAKIRDYDRLFEDYNRLLYHAQHAPYWRTEALRYEEIIADLGRRLRECEETD